MARPLRLEFPGSFWHVTTRGNERRDIVANDDDRHLFLNLLGEAAERFQWIVYQYVLMTNHYHLVVQLTNMTLSAGMQWLNGRYAQAFNRRHGRVGHLFQGRFHARLLEEEVYLLEVLRYVVLNPVRAAMVARPEEYAWSGHCATAGLCDAPRWLAVNRVHRCFAPEPELARALYLQFVDDGIGLARSPWQDIVGQIYLGTDAWMDEVREKVAVRPRSDEHPLSQRERLPLPMATVIGAVASALSVSENLVRFGRGGKARMLAAWVACHQARLDLRSIAAGLRMRSAGGVSTLIRSCESQLECDPELRASLGRCVANLH